MINRLFCSSRPLLLTSLLLAPLAASAGIINNGNFESGNTGFTSGYTYVTPGPGALGAQGTYTVDTNPRNSHASFANMGDHTTGSGNMMIVNGAGDTGVTVWSGLASIPLVIGEQYDFSAWVASVYPASPAILTFSVGSASGTIAASGPVGEWERLFFSFTAETASPTFSLLNANAAYVGNDFAVDDIDIYYRGTTVNPTEPRDPVSQVPDSGAGVVGLAALVGLLVTGARRRR